MLSQLGFETIEAANGREGVKKAQALRPDLILMDIVMPEIGGREATRQLRQSLECKDVPIIAVSASASDHDTKDCFIAGVNAFLPKPIMMARLLDEMGPLLKLTWIQEPEQAEPALTEIIDTEPVVAPPEEEIKVLYHLARRGRMHDVLEWTERASALLEVRHQPFVSRIRGLAKTYQSKAILGFVEQHMKEDKAQ
jgi:CheY-like chemotaxis protein